MNIVPACYISHDIGTEQFAELCKKPDLNRHFLFLCVVLLVAMPLHASQEGCVSMQISSPCACSPSQMKSRFVSRSPLPRKIFDHFICLNGTYDTRMLHPITGNYFSWRGFRKDAFQAGGCSGNDRRCLPIESADASMEERDLFCYRDIIEQVPGWVVIHCIHNPFCIFR